jgi:hypothetical protein
VLTVDTRSGGITGVMRGSDASVAAVQSMTNRSVTTTKSGANTQRSGDDDGASFDELTEQGVIKEGKMDVTTVTVTKTMKHAGDASKKMKRGTKKTVKQTDPASNSDSDASSSSSSDSSDSSSDEEEENARKRKKKKKKRKKKMKKKVMKAEAKEDDDDDPFAAIAAMTK